MRRFDVPLELTRPMVAAGAGLHANDARRQCRDEFEQLGTRQTGAHQRWLGCGINAMNSKGVLGEINTDGDNVRHGLPLSKTSELMSDRTFRRGTLMPYLATVWITRDGEVLVIR
jgi:hypothetical protein